MWSENVVFSFGVCFLNDTSVLSSSGDPGASLRTLLTCLGLHQLIRKHRSLSASLKGVFAFIKQHHVQLVLLY